jgi:hypothetical protein
MHRSRKAATVNSQGRQPLVTSDVLETKPQRGDGRLPGAPPPPWGFFVNYLCTRGSRPWLLTYAPLGLHADA